MYQGQTELHHRFEAGTLSLRGGDLSRALEHFKAAYSGADAAGDADLMAASLCEIAWTCFKIGDVEQGLEFAMGARALWRRLDNPGELVRALSVEAFILIDLGLSDEAYELTSEAVTLGETLGRPAVHAFALNARALALSVCRQDELALPVSGEAIRLSDSIGSSAATGFYRLILGFIHGKLADEAEKVGRAEEAQSMRQQALECSLEAAERAERMGDVWTQRVALCNAAEYLLGDGRAPEALARLAQWTAVEGEASPSLHAHYLFTLGLARRRTGDLDGALSTCSQALALAEQTHQVQHQVNAAEALCDILEAMGDLSGALSMHRRFHALYVRQSGESAGQRARVEEIRAETGKLRARAAELADQALTDALTGIANRRSLDQILNRLAGTPFAVCILDLDHFKAINDACSHIVGDAVLQRVARLMVDQVGRNGHAARLGGEEFALILPDASPAIAAAICEGVRIAVQNADWSDLAPKLAVTVSIGVAAGDGEMPAGTLMQIADRRLYDAKSKGRNRVLAEPAGRVDAGTGPSAGSAM